MFYNLNNFLPNEKEILNYQKRNGGGKYFENLIKVEPLLATNENLFYLDYIYFKKNEIKELVS